MARMNNKVALVVGGAKGIGLAIAERLSAEGANVFITSRRGEDAEKAATGIGNGVVGIAADAGSPDDMIAAVETVRKAYGRVDALVLNAGLSEPSQIADMTPEHFDRHFDVNVRGMVFGFQAALPAMKEGSSVVLIGSIAGSAATRVMELIVQRKQPFDPTHEPGRQNLPQKASASTWLPPALPIRR